MILWLIVAWLIILAGAADLWAIGQDQEAAIADAESAIDRMQRPII